MGFLYIIEGCLLQYPQHRFQADVSTNNEQDIRNSVNKHPAACKTKKGTNQADYNTDNDQVVMRRVI